MYSAIATLLVAVGLGVSPADPAVTEARAMAARLDPVIDRALAEKRIVGTVVLVAQDGKVVYRRAAGFADREAKKPMREDAVFRLASMSKPLVSAAALALVDQHTLSLEDPVTKWIPTFRPKLADGREPVITVRHLLTHTAGLTYGFFQPEQGSYHRAGVSDGLDDVPGLTLEENLRRIASVPLASEPGKRWSYSVAIDVLGEVVARAGGAPLPTVMERFVTRPLGMKDTGFGARDAVRLATAYADGRPEPVRMGEVALVPFGGGTVRYAPGRALDRRAFPSGGAGMVGTAEDFLKFLEALRKGGAPVLAAATVQQWGTDQVGTEAQTQGPGWGWGLASAVLVDPVAAKSPQSAGTWQWGGAYGHSWFVDPRRNLTVVALTNTALEGMSGAFPVAVRDAVYAAAPASAAQAATAQASAASASAAPFPAAPAPAVRLYTLDCGRIDIADMGMFSDTGEHAGERGTLTAPCFLIQHPRGTLLWDAGLGDKLAALPDGEEPVPGSRFRVSATLVSQLGKLGLKPSDIDFVSFSHLHADHAGNAPAFATSTWLVNAAELAWALGSPTPMGVDPRLVRGHAKDKTVSIALDHDVFGDGSVRILKTPGHTPGHQVLMVRLARTGPVILSGDLFHARENFDKSLVPPFNVSRSETLASIDRVHRLMRNTGARLVVQHEPGDIQSLPAFPAYLE
ncbi:serine hydrolase [Pyxidicoccus sp. MSG2]|uniref:serine hydrolase n=1 Tax=Pyxidicoccus sp. MSG2 TaxID=2996790 RepID=UPI00226FAD0B|nr:serine hydrolase [Pyxidicoccus sp. MSG2]MCY1015751.1 serine hydrolase [Pyxidicoccus sp. MSG2]